MPSRGRVDHRSIRLRGRLQPRREVWCLADDVALLHFAGADQFADHDKAGGNADAHLVAAGRAEQICDRVNQRERRTDCVLGVRFVRFRVAEINQHAVAHVFCKIATKARDDLGGALMVGRDHLAQIFRIEPGRQRGRADQITEHHRQLAALG